MTKKGIETAIAEKRPLFFERWWPDSGWVRADSLQWNPVSRCWAVHNTQYQLSVARRSKDICLGKDIPLAALPI